MKKFDEDYIQNQCFMYFQSTYCKPTNPKRGVMFSVANEGATKLGRTLIVKLRSMKVHQSIIKVIENTLSQVTQQLTAMGLVKGVSDTILIFPNGRIFFVEFKAEIGQQRPEQKEFEQRITNLGYEYVLIRSINQFKEWCYVASR